MKTLSTILAATMLATSSLRAQVVNDGASATLANTTNAITGDVTVGTNGSFTLLVLSSNALLTNSVDGVIGRNATAKSNEVRLVSPTARWLMGNNLFVGNNGSFSRLVVSNGALVRNNTGFVGPNVPSSNNVAVVTGPGSVWSNANVFYLGFSGAGNQLIVSNGGVLRNNASTIGVNGGSSNNMAVVTGSGSLWSNASTLQLGFSGAGNQLVVSNGGFVRSSVGAMGSQPSGSNTVAVVTGSGSTWSNAAELYVGNSAASNLLLVSAGGTVRNGHGYVGANFTASNNLALITGAGSVWSNALDLNIGAFSSFNQMIVSNGAAVFAAGNGLIGPTANGNGNSVTVTDAGSRWLAGASLYVGSNGALSRLMISNGGFVADGNGLIGQTSLSRSNEVVVAGLGSVWTNRFDLIVGVGGPLNRLAVSDGGTVTAFGSGILGLSAGASNNLTVVTGSGSRLETDFDLEVGRSGAVNRLTISNGGWVTDRVGVIGNNLSGSNNLVVVTDAGSVWSNRSEMYVGNTGSGNSLVVSNAGTVFAQATRFLGHASGATSNNTAIVTGAGSRWLGPGNLEVGGPAAFCQLLVTDGGRVENNSGFIGSGSTASNNLAVVADPGSVWSNALSLFIGSSGAGNQMVVSNGATVFGDEGLIGYTSSSSNNLAVVTGAGSLWSNAVDLFVGNDGRNNQLIVTNGGFVMGLAGTVGLNATSSNNTAIITGAGSVWTNANSLFVGSSGAGNQLVVTNGGTALSSDGIVGSNSTGDNNVALVTGAGSSWDMAGDLVVGFAGDANRLVVSNAGRVLNNFGGMLSRSNEVVVTGAGSLWSNRLAVIVGGLGRGNRLVVNNGGTVLGANVFVGQESTATNNRVVVDNGTLRVTNASGSAVLDVRRGTNLFNAGLMDVDVLLLTNTLSRFEFNGGTLITRGAVISNSLFVVGNSGSVPAVWDVLTGASNHFIAGGVYVGGAGSFAQLIHTNGALLTNGAEAVLGRDATSRSNSVTLAGAGSRWWLGDGVLVGDGGSGNRLVVRDGASLVTASISYFGDDKTSTNNEAVVTGPGSSWSTADYGLRVGYEGSDNRLLVSDGGVVTSYDDRIGNDLSSSNNLVLVTGPGSLWNNTRELTVGLNSSGNQLVVSNGGTVFTVANKYVGQNDGALSNTAIVTGPGSAWLGDDSLYVGLDGSLNRLFVRHGGRVTSGIATLGANAGANGNLALIADASSVWSNRFDLTVGDGGSANQLVISNGGAVFSASHGFVGRNPGANLNTAIVTDVGTRWQLSSNFYVGNNGSSNRLVLSNGAQLQTEQGIIGGSLGSSNNEAIVTDPGSVWSNAATLFVGFSGAGTGNRLVVSNGALVASFHGTFGGPLTNSDNQALVTGTGSRWTIESTLTVGSIGGGNRLVVSNGASLRSGFAVLGNSPSTNNEVVVTGAGSSWTNGSNLLVGGSSSGNRLTISDGAEVFEQPFNVIIGASASSTNNRLIVDGGALRIPGPGSALDVRGGTNVLNAGLIDVTRLLLTNALGQFDFNGGTLVTSGTAIGNGRVFTVGNGASAATFSLRNGTHSFANNLVVASNASLIGNGTITGTLTVQPGGTFAPGGSVGHIILSNSPALQGATIMEISNNGATFTNDQIQVAAPLAYGGSLTVSNLGGSPLVVGDKFPLFNAAGYLGSFSSVALPPLNAGLDWTNKLLVDGSIEVVRAPQPTFTSINLAGTNVIFSGSNGPPSANYTLLTATNVALPLSNWVSIATNQFDSGGGFSVTNAIVPGLRQQFFQLEVP